MPETGVKRAFDKDMEKINFPDRMQDIFRSMAENKRLILRKFVKKKVISGKKGELFLSEIGHKTKNVLEKKTDGII